MAKKTDYGIQDSGQSKGKGLLNGLSVMGNERYLLIKKYCTESNEYRGIWKIIDEQRELLECLQELSPDVLKHCPWIEGWLARTDMFLVSLLRLLDLPDMPCKAVNFPRPWPGSYPLEYYTPANEEFVR